MTNPRPYATVEPSSGCLGCASQLSSFAHGARPNAQMAGPVKVIEGDQRVTRDLSHPFFWAAFQLYGDWR